MDSSDSNTPRPKRRVRYSGKYPRRFEEKYKELSPDKYPDIVAKVTESGKTPAGTHRPIMVQEIIAALDPKPGEIAVDCTLGYGGHSAELLPRLLPGGRLIGLDADPLELPKTIERMRALGHGEQVFTAVRSNFAGIAKVLAENKLTQADMILADLGVSSMQLDNPQRGFTNKFDGPLDMRMNPNRGQTAADLLKKLASDNLEKLLIENSDEPFARSLAPALAGSHFSSSKELAQRIESTLKGKPADLIKLSIRRVFQALRIAVNDEFGALDALLRQLPACLAPGGRVAILTFHSGEDRRVKHAFADALAKGIYSAISPEPLRPSPQERHANSRSTSAKLRWARAS